MLFVHIPFYFPSIKTYYSFSTFDSSLFSLHILLELLDGYFSEFFSSSCPHNMDVNRKGRLCKMPRANWAFVWFLCDCSHFSLSPTRGEQSWLLEEDSLLKNQPGRLQQEQRKAKEECSRHDE